MDTPPLTLQARRIYILPTSAGVTAAGLLFLMLLAGMNYNNSLALLLCFLLCGVALVIDASNAMRMLARAEAAVRAEADNTFAGHARRAAAALLTTRRRRRAAGCSCASPRAAPSALRARSPPATQTVRLTLSGPARAAASASSGSSCRAMRRWGCFAPGPGCTCRSRRSCIRRPRARAPLPLRAWRAAQRRQRSRRQSGEEEWAWLRPLREGDSPRSVAWKAYARGGPLLVAHYEAPAGAHRLLDFCSCCRTCRSSGAVAAGAMGARLRAPRREPTACSSRSGRCRPGTASRSNAPASKPWRCIQP